MLSKPITQRERQRLRTSLKKHRGGIAEVARRCGVAPVTVTLWLKGHVQSARLDSAVPTLAQAYLAEKGSAA